MVSSRESQGVRLLILEIIDRVNDTSVVLLYSTPDDASASFFFITGEGLDSTALLVAKPFIIETSTELPFTVRAALSTDIRARVSRHSLALPARCADRMMMQDSAAKSEYYKSRPLWSSGRPSRREREEEPKPYEQKGRRKRGGKGRRNRDGDDDSRKTRTAGDLDAELDAYVSRSPFRSYSCADERRRFATVNLSFLSRKMCKLSVRRTKRMELQIIYSILPIRKRRSSVEIPLLRFSE